MGLWSCGAGSCPGSTTHGCVCLGWRRGTDSNAACLWSISKPLSQPLPKKLIPLPFSAKEQKPLWMLTWRQIPKKSQPTSSTNSQTRISVWAQLEHSIFLEPIGSTHCLPWLRAQLIAHVYADPFMCIFSFRLHSHPKRIRKQQEEVD